MKLQTTWWLPTSNYKNLLTYSKVIQTLLPWNPININFICCITSTVNITINFVEQNLSNILPKSKKRTKNNLHELVKSSKTTVHSVHSPTPPFCLGRLNLLPNFQKGGLDRTSILRGGLLKKRGVTFFGGSYTKYF